MGINQQKPLTAKFLTMKHYIFNHSNFKAMGIDVEKINFYTVSMPNCIITFKDNSRQEITLKDIIPVMKQARKQKARIENFSLYSGPGFFRCWSNGNIFWLTPTKNTVECTCKDYSIIGNISNDLLCKHGYKLLTQLNITLYSKEYYELVSEMEGKVVDTGENIKYY